MKPEKLLKEFGHHLRTIRKIRKLSQEQLGLLAELDRTYISGIERGVRNISLLNIFKLAQALEIPPSDLFIFGEKQ